MISKDKLNIPLIKEVLNSSELNKSNKPLEVFLFYTEYLDKTIIKLC